MALKMGEEIVKLHLMYRITILAFVFSLFFSFSQHSAHAEGSVKVSTGSGFTVLLSGDGTVWVRGMNDYNQVGPNYGYTYVENFTRIEGLNNIVDVAATFDKVLALKSDGTVWYWGNWWDESEKPKKLKGVSDATKILSWGFTSGESGGYIGGEYLILRKTGEFGYVDWDFDKEEHFYNILTWNGEFFNKLYKDIIDFDGTALDYGDGIHEVLLKSDGSVWTYSSDNTGGFALSGANKFGQLGIGNFKRNEDSETFQVPNLSNIVQIESEKHRNVVLGKNGTVWAWGLNDLGQLGDGTRENKATPTKVFTDAKDISLTVNRTYALKKDGTVWLLGGRIGYDESKIIRYSEFFGERYPIYESISQLEPMKIEGLEDVVEIESGKTWTIAVKKDGSVWYVGATEDEAGPEETISQGQQKLFNLKPKKIEGFSLHIPTETYKTVENEETKSTISVYINGDEQLYDQPPIIENGSTLVPLRGIFEALGADVIWDSNTRTVFATKGMTSIHLPINSNAASVNGKSLPLVVPAQIKNGRTLVPLRFVSEVLGAEALWNGETKTVQINQ
jgi:alpha-tubulin suppressor-like RCC1 family protein